ncbi:DUF1175 family protein [Deinococcus sp.]|uniref:DUF1175 family protein n=1 Tax=Deinococcus sp. TaxID=47478 RepID=UPI003CC5041F
MTFRALLRPVLLGLLASAAALALPLPVSSALDSDHDGYPDALELVGSDRASFADWFASVAQSQYYGMNADWKPETRDCSGLLRYAYFNALSAHTPAWYAKFRYLPPPQTPPVRAYHLPAPLVRYSLFRVAAGDYRSGDVEAGRMVGRTTVQYLIQYSAVFVSRDPARARRGDLLIFLRPELRAYHSMVYLGGGLVVYHTGASPAEGGQVRLVTLATLMRHPDAAFHPTLSNRNFLGVYRWKILD